MKTKIKSKGFRLRVFSRHPSHNALRQAELRLPVLTCIRFGSVTVTDVKYKCEINLPEAVQISSNKLRMKECFTKAGIKTPVWWVYQDGKFLNKIDGTTVDKIDVPLVIKSLFGSRGRGNTLIKNHEELMAFIKSHDMKNFIIEKYYSYIKEYRLHVTKEGCFYTCRKMIKADTPENKRWFRNDSNSVWIMEENKDFDKPVNWDAIISDCVKGLESVGLDVGAFDVRVQGTNTNDGKPRPNPDWIVIECNSAPSFGDITLQKYMEEIPKIVNLKTKI